MIINKNNILIKVTDEVDSIHHIDKRKFSYKYTLLKDHNIKSVILNRSILLNDSYYYFVFDLRYRLFEIFLENKEGYPDEYLTEYKLLDNTMVSLEIKKIANDDQYILYIDIAPITKEVN